MAAQSMSLSSTTLEESEPIARTKRRLEFIDVLRAVACLWVVLFHATGGIPPVQLLHSYHHGPIPVPVLLRYFAGMGYRGVPMFLCLSGLCLFLPCVQKHDLPAVRVNFREFMKRRNIRILPPYYVSLAIFAVLCNLKRLHILYGMPGEMGGAGSLVTHLLMIFNLRPESIGTICGAYWSLAVEYQIYLVFPALLAVTRRFGLYGLLLATTAVATAWGFYEVWRHPYTSDWIHNIYYFNTPLDFILFFAIGMACAAIIAYPQYEKLQKWLMIAAAVAVVPAVVGESSAVPYCLVNVLWGFVFAGSIVAASRVRAYVYNENPLLAALRNIGAMSYSIYLVHQPLIGMLRYYLPHKAAIVAAVIVSAGAGWLFHLAFERPFLNMRQRSAAFMRRPAGSPARL